MAIGFCAAILGGCSFPVMIVLYGGIANDFILEKINEGNSSGVEDGSKFTDNITFFGRIFFISIDFIKI